VPWFSPWLAVQYQDEHGLNCTSKGTDQEWIGRLSAAGSPFGTLKQHLRRVAPSSFHPTVDGQRAYKRAMRSALGR
jgi:hypothetical protein